MSAGRPEADPAILRIEGGYSAALRAAISGWWNHLFTLIGLNLLWTLALFSVVAAPPATAAFFYVARQVLLREIDFDWRAFLTAFRRYLLPAWGWALAFFLFAAVGILNLWFYREATGLLWGALRWLWSAIMVLWISINLFFWPLWFAQQPASRTLRNTWRNAFIFLVTAPLPALVTTVAILLFAALSVFTGVLLGTIFMAWTSLLLTAVMAAYLPPVER